MRRMMRRSWWRGCARTTSPHRSVGYPHTYYTTYSTHTLHIHKHTLHTDAHTHAHNTNHCDARKSQFQPLPQSRCTINRNTARIFPASKSNTKLTQPFTCSYIRTALNPSLSSLAVCGRQGRAAFLRAGLDQGRDPQQPGCRRG